MFLIDPRSPKAIYEQIIDSVKEQVLKGILCTGDKMPSVRELASMLTVNPNTVSKAYQELERQHSSETLRGKGTYVAATNQRKVDTAKVEAICKDLKKLCIELHYLGLDATAIQAQITQILQELRMED